MKTIEPINSWINGQSVQANVLNSYVINDNLLNSATFYYSLLDNNLPVAEGNLTMNGDAYNGFVDNDYAYNWVASQLNLTITGDYVPPVSPTE